MSNQPWPTQATLTDLQTARIDFARRDLEDARARDLAQLEPADLILLIERLRGRLCDMLDLIDETCESRSRDPRN